MVRPVVRREQRPTRSHMVAQGMQQHIGSRGTGVADKAVQRATGQLRPQRAQMAGPHMLAHDQPEIRPASRLSRSRLAIAATVSRADLLMVVECDPPVGPHLPGLGLADIVQQDGAA